MSRDAGFDRMITVFSPEGRLYQIEYAFKAVNSVGITSVAVRGKGCVAMVTQKKIPDKLIDPASVSRLFAITPKVGCLVTGLTGDGRSLVTECRQEASQFEYNNGFPMPVAVLAARVADLMQVNTQEAGKRSKGVVSMFCGVDDEKGPQLYKVDPAGHYFGYKAVATGVKEQEAMSLLEKKMKGNPELDEDATIQAAVMTLQTCLSADFKPDEIEVGVVVGEAGRFTVLPSEEIERHLTAIAERD